MHRLILLASLALFTTPAHANDTRVAELVNSYVQQDHPGSTWPSVAVLNTNQAFRAKANLIDRSLDCGAVPPATLPTEASQASVDAFERETLAMRHRGEGRFIQADKATMSDYLGRVASAVLTECGGGEVPDLAPLKALHREMGEELERIGG